MDLEPVSADVPVFFFAHVNQAPESMVLSSYKILDYDAELEG